MASRTSIHVSSRPSSKKASTRSTTRSDRASQHLLWVDEELQRDYADSYRPFYEPHRVPWRYRISKDQARELAARMDLLYRQLGRIEEACMMQKVTNFYESLFEDIYCEWLP